MKNELGLPYCSPILSKGVHFQYLNGVNERRPILTSQFRPILSSHIRDCRAFHDWLRGFFFFAYTPYCIFNVISINVHSYQYTHCASRKDTRIIPELFRFLEETHTPPGGEPVTR